MLLSKNLWLLHYLNVQFNNDWTDIFRYKKENNNKSLDGPYLTSKFSMHFILFISLFQIISDLWFPLMDWHNEAEQQCNRVYTVRLDTGSPEAENGVCNLLNFLHGYCGGEYTHYCDNQVQPDSWESHVLFPVLFVLRWLMLFNIHSPKTHCGCHL